MMIATLFKKQFEIRVALACQRFVHKRQYVVKDRPNLPFRI